MRPRARSGWRCSRPTSTSRSSRTSSGGSASARSAPRSSRSLTAGQQVVKIVHDELVELLSAGDRTFRLQGNPAVISLVGPAGLRQDDHGGEARAAHRQARAPPAARRGGSVPARRRGPARDARARPSTSRSTGRPAGTSTVDIARGSLDEARRLTRDTIILDTAGRLSLDEALMAEIAAVDSAVHPVETLLVVDAMTGQEAVGVAQAFAAAVPVTGLILTKVDGDARGGAALSIATVTGLGVKFMGTGEKTDALEVFHPDRLAGRILGMGDVHDARRAGAGDGRRRPGGEARGEAAQGRVHARGLPRPAPAGPEDGPDRPARLDDPGDGRHGQGRPGRGRPRRPAADGGDHSLDDAPRTTRPERPHWRRAGDASRPARGPP